MASDWWKGFFDDQYLDNWPGAAASAEMTVQQVEFIIQALELAPGARVLDACCGEGRHCRELARRGFDVTGVDQSAESLARARVQEPVVTYVHQDIGEMQFDAEFDAAINMFTAFGYMDEAGNEQFLRAVARALRPGGALVLDTMSPFWLARNYRPRDWHEVPCGLMLDDRRYDLVTGRIDSHVTYLAAEGKVERDTSIRAYTPTELGGLLGQVGLEAASWYGGFDASPLTLESRRLIVVARKVAG